MAEWVESNTFHPKRQKLQFVSNEIDKPAPAVSCHETLPVCVGVCVCALPVLAIPLPVWIRKTWPAFLHKCRACRWTPNETHMLIWVTVASKKIGHPSNTPLQQRAACGTGTSCQGWGHGEPCHSQHRKQMRHSYYANSWQHGRFQGHSGKREEE